MASDLYRCSWVFSGKKKGWSETWVIPRDNTTPAALSGLLTPVSQLRANMLGREFRIDAIRISKIRLANGNKVKRQVFLFETPFIPTDLTGANAADAPDAAVIGNAVDITGSFRKQFFLGAPPDAIIVNGGDLDTGINGWGGKFTSWALQMVALNAGWLNRVPVQLAGMDFVTITNYAVAVTGIVTITSDVGTWGLPPYVKQVVSIRGLNGSHSNLNGQLLVLPKTETTCVTVKPRPSLPFQSDGFMTHYQQPYPNIVSSLITAVKAGNHKRGRPLLVSPGRRAAIVRV